MDIVCKRAKDKIAMNFERTAEKDPAVVFDSRVRTHGFYQNQNERMISSATSRLGWR